MKKIIYISVLLMFSSSICFANDIIKALDADKDNLVAMEEAKILPELLAQFTELDKNKDNMLDATEILSYKKPE